MTTASIRRCRAQDWAEVRRLHLQMALGVPLAVDVAINEVFATPERHWQDYTAACARQADQALFVAHVDAACVGMGHVRLENDQARLSALFVNEAWRRHGIGAAILEGLETWARQAGARALLCHIPDTSAAVHLAERTGWQRTDERFTAKNRLVERRWVKGSP